MTRRHLDRTVGRTVRGVQSNGTKPHVSESDRGYETKTELEPWAWTVAEIERDNIKAGRAGKRLR